MLWKNARRSNNVIDNRGISLGAKTKGGAAGVFIMALVVYALGGDPTQLLVEGVQRSITRSPESTISTAQENEQADFVSAILASTEDVWAKRFAASGSQYIQPKLVLFSGAVNSACGYAEAAMGPFYCSLDSQAYIDLGFFQTLSDRLQAPGDFARAYVIAHEIGHHVQNLMGISDKIHTAQQRASKRTANALSVKMELQADCFAGIWAHDANVDYKLLEAGDLDEALNAATRIGDDTLQKQSQGYVVPDSFTHGSAAQRKAAFLRGADSGNLDNCKI